ncbi:hypothetical protein DEIPH_ctg027orf0003 [Deinococcus phoenicis]|uniref:Uncharacterized protein n=1 Tax=Deinococcus phoenicis TaxID=1476583 RepID=A0A016QPN8_9DEIO|nr:hypothetical protein DEIPH_ctg027orf0003 [Deinococcus phoenicis]
MGLSEPGLSGADLRALVPEGAAQVFMEGDEQRALTLLRRARDAQPPGTVPWAVLERLAGLVLIHVLREVEGTFALERADAVLDAAGQPRPSLAWLEAGAGEAGER